MSGSIGFRSSPINGETTLTGILGGDTSHSVTPFLYSEIFERLGLNTVYLCFNTTPENLANAVNSIRGFSIKAMYITMPYKQKVIPLLDEVDPMANAMGAVNLVVNNGGILKGYNIDMLAFMGPLKKTPLKGEKVVLLGSGGAGSACAFGLAQAGAELTILSRTEESAASLAQRVTDYFGTKAVGISNSEDRLRNELADAFMVVNSTDIGYGSKEGQTPVPAEFLRKDLIVYDVVNASNTPITRDARACGAKVFDGMDFLAYGTKEFVQALTGKETSQAVVDLALEVGQKVLEYDAQKHNR